MSITFVIIAINIASSYAAFNNYHLKSRLMMNPVAISQHGQWYRLISSGFIHSDWSHLGFNMFSFYFFGHQVEGIFKQIKGNEEGAVWFVAFYLLGLIVSDFPSVIKHKNNQYFNSLGASGAVAAVVFCSILFFPTQNIYLFAILPVPGFILGGLYLYYSYNKGKQMTDNINHDAHLFGAVFGLVFSVIIYPDVLETFFYQLMNWSMF